MKTEETFSQELNLVLDENFLNMKQVAKILDFGIGRNTLFGILRSSQILDGRNEPYQHYINQGYFKLRKKNRLSLPFQFDTVTLVTEKGLTFIENLLAKENISNN